VVGRRSYAPAAFTPGEIRGTHFQRMLWQLLAYISDAVGVTKLDITRRAHTDICNTGLSGSLFTKTYVDPSWLHRASNNVETFSLPTDAHNVKKHRVIKTF